MQFHCRYPFGVKNWHDFPDSSWYILVCLTHKVLHFNIKKQRHYFANKGPSSQGYGFSSSHVWMWELDYKKSWAPKNWCFWTVVLEKTLESPLDSREIQPVHPEGNQSWIFIGRTDAEAEAPILWPPDMKNWFIGKDPDAGKNWRREEKRTRGWDGWMASPIQWTWVWASSGSWWWTGKPGVLQSIGSQRVEHNWATELTEFKVQKKPQEGNIKLWNKGWICGCVFWGIPWHILRTYMNGTQEWRERESFHEFI